MTITVGNDVNNHKNDNSPDNDNHKPDHNYTNTTDACDLICMQSRDSNTYSNKRTINNDNIDNRLIMVNSMTV